MKYQEIISGISPLSGEVLKQAKERLDRLTKPLGSLGVLEDCAAQYAAARGDLNAGITKKALLTFAGDHGVTEEGVSNVPSAVTVMMLKNMSRGGAGINVLTRFENAEHKIIDIGVASPCDFPHILHRHIANGTNNIAKGPAMTLEEADHAFEAGALEALESIQDGATLLGTGEMGIGNTTPSAALYCAFLKIAPEEACGCGTGINEDALKRKVRAVRNALKVNADAVRQGPFETLAALGGLEIAAIAGMTAMCAKQRVPVVVDGYISTAAALAAIRLNPAIRDYCYFSHLSGDQGHAHALRKMGVKPLLDLGMRLGEGTGAALAFHLLEGANRLFLEMATFESAGML